MIPVCSVATTKSLKEFELLKFSFEQYHSDAYWYVATDDYAAQQLSKYKNVRVLNLVKTDDCSHGVDDPIKNRLFLELIMTKFDTLETAIKEHGYGLFLDSDIFFTGPLEDRFIKLMLDEDIDAILSPHMTNNLGLETKVGHYNVGFFAVRNVDYLEAHKGMSWKHKELGLYYEQQPLQFTSYEYMTVNSPIYYNLGWWRFNENHNKHRINWLQKQNNVLTFKGHQAVCFHAHTLKKLDYQNVVVNFVNHVFKLMSECENEKYAAFLEKFDELRTS